MKSGWMSAVLVAAALMIGASSGSGQDAEVLVSQCVLGGGVPRNWCREVAIAAQVLRAGRANPDVVVVRLRGPA